jgi:hypothetical protein
VRSSTLWASGMASVRAAISAARSSGGDLTALSWNFLASSGFASESPRASAPSPPVSRWRSTSSNQHRLGGGPSTHPTSSRWSVPARYSRTASSSNDPTNQCAVRRRSSPAPNGPRLGVATDEALTVGGIAQQFRDRRRHRTFYKMGKRAHDHTVARIVRGRHAPAATGGRRTISTGRSISPRARFPLIPTKQHPWRRPEPVVWAGSGLTPRVDGHDGSEFALDNLRGVEAPRFAIPRSDHLNSGREVSFEAGGDCGRR